MRKERNRMNTNQASSRSDIVEESVQTRGITWRALVIGLLYVVFLAYVNPRAELGQLLPGIDVTGAPQGAGLGLVFLLLLQNLLLKQKRLKFSTQEMITVYVISMLGGLIVGRGLISFFVITTMAPHMLRLQDAKLYKGFLDSLSTLIIPKGSDAVKGFLRGGAKGIPWGEWAIPILIWACFFTIVFWVMLCILTIVRKQWVEHERLVFPLVATVMEMVEEPKTGQIPFWRDKVVYLGMIYPIFYYGLPILNKYSPMIPVIPDQIFILRPITSSPPFNVLEGFFFSPRPLVIGIGYLLSLDMVFSMWFFYLIREATYVYYNIVGVYDNFHKYLFRQQGMGAFVAIAVINLWIARGQLKNIIKKGLRLEVEESDENEPISFGLAFWGGSLGFVFIIVFTKVFLHVHPFWSVVYFLLFFAAVLAFSKIRAEAGYPYTHCIPIQIDRSLAQTIGGTVLRDNALGLGYFFSLTYGFFGASSAIALESYKFGDEVGIRRKSMTKVMLLVVFFAIVVGFISALMMFYDMGVNSVHSWYTLTAKDVAFNWAAGSQDSNTANTFEFGKGIIIGGALMFLRRAYVWWPFHPLGYAIANTDYLTYFWGGFFIAWLIKFAVFRYGGPRVSQKLVPFFMGMIAGSVIVGLFGAVVGAIVQLF
jgi:hypothetical protein